VLVVSTCTAWSTTAPALRAIGGDPADQTREHRAAVVAAVAAVVDALG